MGPVYPQSKERMFDGFVRRTAWAVLHVQLFVGYLTAGIVLVARGGVLFSLLLSGSPLFAARSQSRGPECGADKCFSGTNA